MYTAEHKEYRSTLATQLITSRKISEELRRVLNSSQLEALYDKLRKKRNEILTEAKKTNEYLDSKRAHDQYKGNQKLISKIMDETGLSEQEAQEVLGTKEDVLDLPEKIEKVSLPATQDLMETLSPSFIIDHLRKILTTPGLSLEEKWEKLKFSTNDLQPVGRIQWRNIFKAFTISEEKAKKLRTKISSIHEANKGKSDLSYLPLNFIEALINIYNEDISSTEKQKKTEIFIDTFLRFNGLSHSTRKGADHHSDNETQWNKEKKEKSNKKKLIARDSLLEIALALDNPDIASKTEALRTLRLGQKIGIWRSSILDSLQVPDSFHKSLIMKIHNTGFRQGDAGLAINFVEDLVDIHSKILAPEEKSQKILARVDSFLNTNSRSWGRKREETSLKEEAPGEKSGKWRVSKEVQIALEAQAGFPKDHPCSTRQVGESIIESDFKRIAKFTLTQLEFWQKKQFPLPALFADGFPRGGGVFRYKFLLGYTYTPEGKQLPVYIFVDKHTEKSYDRDHLYQIKIEKTDPINRKKSPSLQLLGHF